ncbi:hypothetical protein ACFU99_26900 [Streptomyces sp. NPDC057654]|uniref:hypothetical protein n=1 Tax=Streptomyces sp. NPDC057654 TaxID=3346196 RepID=UPI0036896C9B
MSSSHPTARDADLYRAVQDIRVGHWMRMSEVLAKTGHWPQWTARTQALAAEAAETNVVELWLKEEPASHAAHVMYARVTTERVLRTHRAQKTGQTRQWERLADLAWQECSKAAEENYYDPVPWICAIALMGTDTAGRFPRYRVPPPPPEHLLPHGPWELLEKTHRRDPWNREAWHRMSQALQTQPGPAGRRAVAGDFARWTCSIAPDNSPLLLLPIYALVQDHRERRARHEPMLSQLWTRGDIVQATTRAFTGWFKKCDPATSSQLDLNYLAYALVACGFPDWAAEVFEAIGDFATQHPWEDFAQHPSQWRDAFETARDGCRKPSARGRR